MPTAALPRLDRSGALCIVCALCLLALAACAGGPAELNGWQATRPGIDMRLEAGAGPQGEAVVALLYTIATGEEYGIERSVGMPAQNAGFRLILQAKATRVLHLAVVVVDSSGREYASARTLVPDGWRELVFSDFGLLADDVAEITSIRLVDRTGSLGGQGPVSLKLVGLPM
jgi:hypothetical protein